MSLVVVSVCKFNDYFFNFCPLLLVFCQITYVFYVFNIKPKDVSYVVSFPGRETDLR